MHKIPDVVQVRHARGKNAHQGVQTERWTERHGKIWFKRSQIMADLGSRVRILDIILQVMGSAQVSKCLLSCFVRNQPMPGNSAGNRETSEEAEQWPRYKTTVATVSREYQ